MKPLLKSVEKSNLLRQVTCNVLNQQMKGRLPMMGSSMCVYEFNYSCGASYVGRTQRVLSLLAYQNVPG